MSGIEFADFRNFPAIGTSSLGSCSVVAITSETGAILAHIPPRLDSADPYDPDAGDNNVRAMMQDIRQLYDQGVDYGYFSAGSAGHVVCAVFKSQIALPHQVDIMESTLRDMGLGSVTHKYDVPVDRKVVGHGTVVVLSSLRQARMPSVYVQNRLVTDPSAAPMDAEIAMLLENNAADVPAIHVGLAPTSNFAEHSAQAYFPEDNLMATDTTWVHGNTTGQSSSYAQPEAAEDIMWTHGDATGQSSSSIQPEEAMNATWMQGDATTYSSSHNQPEAAGEFTRVGDVPSDPAYDGNDMASSPTPASSKSTTTWVRVDVRLQPHMMRSTKYVFRNETGQSITTEKGDWKRKRYNGQDVSAYKQGRTRYYTHKRIV